MFGSLDEPAPNRNNSSKSTFGKKNNSKLAFKKNDGNGKIDGFSVSDVKYIKKIKKIKG